MKKVMLSMLIALTAFSLVTVEADAKRLGGGGSSGRQSSNVTQKAAPAPAPSNTAARPAAPAATPSPAAIPPKPASPWRGILGGALLGLGLGALMSHFGMGGALGGMLGSILMMALLAAAVFFIIRMFRRKNTDSLAPAGAYGSGAESGFNKVEAPYARTNTPEIGSGLSQASSQTPSPSFGASPALDAPVASNPGTWTVPADFDVPAFLRNAKAYFIRLQAAWDKADLNDIREFTSTEMFAEFRLELQERGTSANITDVVKLDAELLGVETLGNDYLASVKFTGLIKEDPAADAAPFAEVWNLSKPVSGQGGWVLAGIQQLS
ncbi:MAG: Tim44 domain-containing protein [Herminiimonas sp.]|nr:Tim44 domain-containing protein [Herminiimonas sp.]